MRERERVCRRSADGPCRTRAPSLHGPNAGVSSDASTPARRNMGTEFLVEKQVHLFLMMSDGMVECTAGRQEEDGSWVLRTDEFVVRDMRSLSSSSDGVDGILVEEEFD